MKSILSLYTEKKSLNGIEAPNVAIGTDHFIVIIIKRKVGKL